MEQKTTAEIFLPLIQRVEEPYRKLLAHTYVEGLSPDQIAQRYLLETEHVQEDLERAHKSMRRKIPDNSMLQLGDPEHYLQAIAAVLATGLASPSNMQRKLKVNYFRATRLLDQMEVDGFVGPRNGGKPRKVLISITTSTTQH